MLAVDLPHKMDTRDAILFNTTPILPVPRFGPPLPPVEPGRRRFLAAADGLYLEAASSALRVRFRINEAEMPYGTTSSEIVFAGGPVPKALLRAFLAAAREACPIEAAALVLLTPSGDGYELVQPPIRHAGAGEVSYDEGAIDLDRLVLDMHSHGHAGAFFSDTDDDSDLGRQGPHLSLVLGRNGADQEAELCARICCPPYLVEIPAACIPVAEAMR